MKRLAMLIGNTNGLPGIHKDLEDFGRFLCSNTGGAWNPDLEIIKSYNILLEELKKTLDEVKNAKLDYFIFYYSGHGGLNRTSGETILELNKFGECIDEIEISNLADRQLNIFDCCRALPEKIEKSLVEDSAQFSVENCSLKIRDIYNARIMQADKQQISLYACSKLECANATGEGSIYTQNLIKAAKSCDSGEVLVLDAHRAACTPTRQKASKLGEKQNPDYKANPFIPEEKQLILSISTFHLQG